MANEGSSRNWTGLVHFERRTLERPLRYLELIVVVICFLVRAARLQLRLAYQDLNRLFLAN